jgi:hypothetical protein
LSPAGEREKNVSLIVRSACVILRRQVEVFVPAVSQKVRDESLTSFYLDGYVFIRFEEGVPYLRLQETTYFRSVLLKPGGGSGRHPNYSTLGDADLLPMREGLNSLKLNNFSRDDSVKVIKGVHKNLRGVVSAVYEDGETVQVYVALRSKSILIDFPATYLEKVTE